MSIPHFFIDQYIEGGAGDSVKLSLSEDVIDHLHTLRLKANENIILVDRPGHAWKICLAAAPNKKDRTIEGSLLSELEDCQESELTLIQGISVAERMDKTIRQVTELGVSRIIPLESERSTVRLKAADRAKKRERWQRIARGAAEQSGQLRYPTVENPVSLADALGMLDDYDLLLFFWEEAEGGSLSEVMSGYVSQARTSELSTGCATQSKAMRIALFIGPEGGFSQDEAERIVAHGAHTLTLGHTILRTETAAVVASALVLYHLGALGGS